MSSLHHHLDFGNHQYVLERETLYDKAMLLYATKLEEGASSTVPQISLPGRDDQATPVSQLPMGWALKSSKTHKRLSKKQKEFLLEIYNVGCQTGHKADPSAVAQSMRKARLPSGEPMFSMDEFLSSQQISSFFSRETAKRRAAPTSTSAENIAAERESALQDLQREVLNAIAICHPIMYGSLNLCFQHSTKKLDRLSVLTLQDICSSFELGTSHIKVKRKKPYIEVLGSLLDKCSCKTEAT